MAALAEDCDMNISLTMRRAVFRGACAALLVLGTSSLAQAQGFISPFIGYNFGGDSGCAEVTVTDCETKSRNLGFSVGSIGSVIGGEFELNFIDNFFGDRNDLSSNVFTLMGNVMIAPKLAAVQPYVVTGLGLMKTHVEFTVPGLLEADNNHLAWNIGGGVIGFFTPHFGVRGDLRYFHSFQDLEILGFNLSETKLDYGRVTGGVIFKF
jgi:Outer membrane protein beta-barrel domain